MDLEAVEVDSLRVLEAAAKASRGERSAWVRLGYAYLENGDLVRAKKAFWKGTRGESKAAAYNGLGLAYLQDQKRFRRKALEYFRRALAADPAFHEARMNIARAHMEMGNMDAEAALQEVVQADSTYAVQALYWAARYKMWQMTMFLEGEKEEGRIQTGSFGREGREKAIGYLQQALEMESEHKPSVLLLGALYYESGSSQQMVDLFEEYLERHPDDRDVRFFSGLGYEKLGEINRAYRAYRTGVDQMPAEERAFVNSMLMEEKLGCWKVRDPLFLTRVNERLMEHYRRVAYANLLFGNPFREVEGWHTAKGKVFIRYGRPLVRYGYPYQTETWGYDGFRVVFSYTGIQDTWRLQSAWMDRREMRLSELISRVPEVYRDPFHFKRYFAPHQVAQFRGENDRTRVEVYYALAGEEVKHRRMQPGINEVNFRQGLFLFTEACEPVWREVRTVDRMPWIVYDAVREGYLFASERLALEPGRYTLAAEVGDLETETVGSFRDGLQVRRFGRDSLEVSSLLLARRVEEQEERSFGRDRFMILPEPLKQVMQGGQLWVYFEVYNLKKDTFGATHYRVTYQVEVLTEEIRAGAGPGWTTAVSQEYRGTEVWEPHYTAVEIHVETPGARKLRVVVEDVKTGREVVAEEGFRVVW